MLRRFLRALLALAVATVVVIYAKFSLWRADIVRELEARSTFISVSHGTRIDTLVYEFVAEHLPDANGG